jgi:hypothetical protein
MLPLFLVLFTTSATLCVDLYDHSKSVVSGAEARRYRDMMLNSSRDLYQFHNHTFLDYKKQYDALATPEEKRAFPSYKLWLEKPLQSICYQTHRKMVKDINGKASELGQKDAVAANKANRTDIEAELVYARERVTTLAALLKAGLVIEFNSEHLGMGISIDSSDMKSSFGAGFELCRQTDAEYVEALRNALQAKRDPDTEPANSGKNNKPGPPVNGVIDLGGPQPLWPLSTRVILGFAGLLCIAGAAGFAWHKHHTRFPGDLVPNSHSEGNSYSDPNGGSELLAIANEGEDRV